MKAPEKIYLQVCGDCTINDKETCEQCYKDNPISSSREVTWCVDKIFNNDVEYTRTDTFIEKACKFISDRVDIPFNVECSNGKPLAASYSKYLSARLEAVNKTIEEFKDFMKGE